MSSRRLTQRRLRWCQKKILKREKIKNIFLKGGEAEGIPGEDCCHPEEPAPPGKVSYFRHQHKANHLPRIWHTDSNNESETEKEFHFCNVF